MSLVKNIARGCPDVEVSKAASGSGILRFDAGLSILFLDEAAARLIGIPAETLLEQKIDQAVDLANLSNLVKSGISFSNQIIVAGTRRIACDYTPITEEDSIVGGVLTLGNLLPKLAVDASDELRELLRLQQMNSCVLSPDATVVACRNLRSNPPVQRHGQ